MSIELPRHGSPEDRGAADAFYDRPRDPHYYVGATYSSPRVGYNQMTDDQIDQYNYGYDQQKNAGVYIG